MNATRFVIAKYVPDPMRMEPRNIGIILWGKSQVRYRFLKEKDASEFITDVATYRRWIDFWKYTIDNDDLELRGKATRQSDPAYLDEFLKTQKGNYMLDSCGEMLDLIKTKDLDKAVDQIFRDLVSTKKDKPSEIITPLDDRCAKLFSDSGISQRDDYYEGKKYPIRFGSLTREIKFDFALGNGTPEVLFKKSKVRSELNAEAAAGLCRSALDSFANSRQVTLVSADEDELSIKAIAERIAMLSQYSTVINVDNYANAMERLYKVTA